jgi:excisionase family DNA binding protein
VADKMLTTEEAAVVCGLSPRTLEKLRSEGGGPRFLKIRRKVKYRERELDEWIARSVRVSTSDPGDGNPPGVGGRRRGLAAGGQEEPEEAARSAWALDRDGRDEGPEDRGDGGQGKGGVQRPR